MKKRFLFLIVLFFIAGCVDDKSLLVNVTKRSNKANIDLRKTLKDGGDVNIQDAQGNTPLIKALSSGNIEAAEIILRYGKNLNVSMTNKKGETALLKAFEHILASGGDYSYKIVRALLQRGAKPSKLIFSNIKIGVLRKGSGDKKYWDDNNYRKLFVNKYKLQDEILLFEYVKAGKVAQVKKELKKGIPINYSDQYDNTALIIACKSNDLKMVEFLVNNKARIEVSSSTHQTPLEIVYSKKIRRWLFSC